MINILKRTTSFIMLLLLSGGSFAQMIVEEKQVSSGPLTESAAAEPPVEMATGLYQSGKIYVVVIVLAVIMIGIFAYLIMLDRKVSKLEKEIEKRD
jgi:CcmD family protein